MRSIVRDRTTLSERSKIIVDAAKSASVGWLVDLAGSAYSAHHPPEGKKPLSEDECITTEADAIKLKKLALAKIEKSAGDGSLLKCRRFISVLYRWDDFLGNQHQERAREWCLSQSEDDKAVEKFADAFVAVSWSHGMGGFGALGDTVAVKKETISKSLSDFFDPEYFKSRVETLLSGCEEGTTMHASLTRFLVAWNTEDDW